MSQRHHRSAYSIECGIQELSMHWIKQDVPDLPTWTASSLALQVTSNHSSGYIDWAMERDGKCYAKTPLLIRI